MTSTPIEEASAEGDDQRKDGDAAGKGDDQRTDVDAESKGATEENAAKEGDEDSSDDDDALHHSLNFAVAMAGKSHFPLVSYRNINSSGQGAVAFVIPARTAAPVDWNPQIPDWYVCMAKGRHGSTGCSCVTLEDNAFIHDQRPEVNGNERLLLIAVVGKMAARLDAHDPAHPIPAEGFRAHLVCRFATGARREEVVATVHEAVKATLPTELVDAFIAVCQIVSQMQAASVTRRFLAFPSIPTCVPRDIDPLVRGPVAHRALQAAEHHNAAIGQGSTGTRPMGPTRSHFERTSAPGCLRIRRLQNLRRHAPERSGLLMDLAA